ncbi:MAG: Xaa-Pro aminopeptidase [Bacteroidales bacterium]
MQKPLIGLVIKLLIAAAIIYWITVMLSPSGLEPGELPEDYIHEHTVPDYDAGSYAERRQRVIHAAGQGLMIISADAGVDFDYLTGFDEDDAIALLGTKENKAFQMFVTPRNPADATWTGERYGVEEAQETFRAGKAWPLDDFQKRLPAIICLYDTIYLHSRDPEVEALVMQVIQENEWTGACLPADSILHENRLIKEQWELAQLEQGVSVTGMAHQWIMKTIAPGQMEYEVQAEIEYVFGKNGLTPGFPSIAGSGPNAAVLHYSDNNRKMKDNDLLLVDIGAKSRGGYTADITRTYPVNGKYSPEQKTIYEIVYKANQEGIKEMKPGKHIMDCNHKAIRVLTQELYKMGLIPDTTSWWQKRFYIQHRVNHYIGLQAHDAGAYGFDPANRDEHILSPEIKGRKLMPGMVITMEPGIYLQENRLEYLQELFGHLAEPDELKAFAEKVRPIYEKYAGIGVRIEDNVLITDTANRVLSEHIPKKISEIETAMKK